VSAFEPRRNLVRRHLDGRQVNVARARGQLFVCANACCCGRTDMTNAPVDTDLYHEEWTTRRLRNFVHLTVGGCLGPCALANVAMLLFDGRSTWFHSVNSPETVRALFDHIEAMLDEGGPREPDNDLAPHVFTGYQWEPRPDGAPVDDPRAWRGRANRPDATPACELDPADLQHGPASFEAATILGDVAEMRAGEAPPRANGELVFATPWQGRAFGMATALSDAGVYDWDTFRTELVREIADESETEYYESWLRAFETLLEKEGIVSPEELAERTAEFEFGERADVY
jgi:nitrile hydratase accessory protein